MSEVDTKACLYCAEEIKVAAKLCRFCGKEQNETGAAAQRDEVFFEGPVMHRTFLGEYILYGLLGLIGLVGSIYCFFMLESEHKNWFALVFLGVLIIGGALSLIRMLKTITTRWRITDRLIQYERGILSKKIETIDLWRIKDISYHQSLWDRMLNEAKIGIVSNDETDPNLTIYGMTKHRELYDKLREAVERRRHGRVLAVESPDA